MRTNVKTMKLEDLRALRDKAAAMFEQRTQRAAEPEWKIVVSMGTSGILYGARDVLKQLLKDVEARGLNAVVTQSGSFGLDNIEPMCAIYHGKEKVVYGNLKPEMIGELLDSHIVRGTVLASHHVVVPDDSASART